MPNNNENDEPDLSCIKKQKIGGGRTMGELTLMNGKEGIDLRKPISIEREIKNNGISKTII